MQALGEVTFLKIRKVKFYQERDIAIELNLRTDSPDIIVGVQVTHKHGKNPLSSKTIEQMTTSIEELKEIVEDADKLYEKLLKIEEIL